jgi:hypothetical protein
MTSRSKALYALFLGPAACAADELFSYVLVYPAAARGSNAMLHVLTALAAAVSLFGIYLSYRVLDRRAGQPAVDTFLALLGIAMNAFFLLVVVAGFGLPKLMLHPTD